MKLNEKILHCRKRAGLSQEALAERIGVSRQAISKWETGEASPEISKLPLLAQTFAVTTDWLLDDTAAPAADGTEAAPAQAGAEDHSSVDAARRDAAWPAWVDQLPGALGRLIRRYGWLLGVRIAISGALFTALGFIARLMSSAMNSTMSDMGSGMLGGFGGSGVTFYDASGNAVSPGSLGLSSTDLTALGLGGGSGFGFDVSAMTQPFDILCGFIITLGLVMLAGGALLAWYLKKWGQEHA
ncbi:MAG: helix-turn-helix domain-containing protein [Clostridia bacterium]|nr:helix-turn-helix domain-containing protein [Clostridia bacterium]